MYEVEVKAIGGWTRHSEHENYGDARNQADLVHGRVTHEGKEVTNLHDWNNDDDGPISCLWICGIGYPTGIEFTHNTETDDDETYCDLGELDILFRLWDLNGTVDENGTWCWDGEGDVRDDMGNTIYNVKARK